MKIDMKGVKLAAGAVLMFVSGVAYADITEDRYYEAGANITKATALLNATFPNSPRETRQRDRAITALAEAQSRIDCALIKRVDPSQSCQ